MASFLYKDYLIVSAADCDRKSLEWKPWVSICWRDDGRQNLHLIRFTHEKFQTAAEAETFGKSAGEKWVDERAVGKKSSGQRQFLNGVENGSRASKLDSTRIG